MHVITLKHQIIYTYFNVGYFIYQLNHNNFQKSLYY